MTASRRDWWVVAGRPNSWLNKLERWFVQHTNRCRRRLARPFTAGGRRDTPPPVTGAPWDR
jgi:hypothetical protein